jgi:hypothetical protein
LEVAVRIAELTDPAAVERAIKEYDDLRPVAFFARYPFFGPALRYDLVHGGRSYPSKAIAGVAYGYQYPDRGVLEKRNGGKETIEALVGMGFSVVDRHEVP